MAVRDDSMVDVLIVGAGPAGLTLAAELRAFGTSFRIVDQAPDAVHESRALAIQARTLEVLTPLGVAEQLVAQGEPAVTLVMHFAHGASEVKLFDEGLDETAYPYLLFLSQAKTEKILADHLEMMDVMIERGVELRRLSTDNDHVTSVLRKGTGEIEIRSRYVVGCDGAHSATRHASGLGFAGTAFPQTFVIADLEAEGLEVGRVHVYPSDQGMLFFFPLGSPATWRMLVMVPPDDRFTTPSVASLQAIADRYTRDQVRLHSAVWMTNFSVQSRRADHFCNGRIFLAGDAAHIYSPAGAQGMNTGIQDAVNLGWKLAMVCRGDANVCLLDTYEQERAPIARSVLRMTNRAFRIATSTSPFLRFFRPRVAALLAPLALRLRALRRFGFRVISQLGIRYRRSPLSVEGKPRLRRGPRPGDRVPDAPISIDGASTTIHRSLSPAAFHILLCGPANDWLDYEDVTDSWAGSVRTAYLRTAGGAGVWVDSSHTALRRLGLNGYGTAQYLVRPDGHIGYRVRGTDLDGLRSYLRAL